MEKKCGNITTTQLKFTGKNGRSTIEKSGG